MASGSTARAFRAVAMPARRLMLTPLRSEDAGPMAMALGTATSLRAGFMA